MTSLLLSVLRRGTEKYPTLADLNRRLDYLYGTELSIRNFYRGDCQVIGFSADLLDDAYLPLGGESLIDGALDVMEQILFHPSLDENGYLLSRYVESEKQLQCDQIRARKNHPRAYAADRCRELLYRDEPCGTPVYGTEEQVLAVTAEQLTAHWKALISTLRLDCFYVGGIEADVVSDALRRFLDKKVQAVPVERSTPVSGSVSLHDETCRVDEDLPVGQGQLVLGLRSGVTLTDEDFYACAVYNELLGVSPVSKLFVNVREKQSLCYHCSSTYNIYKGAILISCGLENANRARAEHSILEQIRALSEGDFSEAELDAAKRSLENAYRMLEDSPAAMESYYFGRALAGVSASVDQCRQGFAEVTRDQVLTVAQKLFVSVVYYLRGTLPSGEEDADEMD